MLCRHDTTPEKGECMGTNITRRAFVGTVGAAGLTLAACSSDGGDTTIAAVDGMTIAGTYAAHIQGFDWGCGVDKITITLDAALDAADAADFVVSENKMATDFTDDTFPIVETTIPREVTGATLSDDGKTLELELACRPDDGDGP